jgi:hypothetical protein
VLGLVVIVWQGFLAGWPGLPNNVYHESWDGRLVFGVSLWLKAPMVLKLALAQSFFTIGSFDLVRSLSPLSAIRHREDPPLPDANVAPAAVSAP